MFFENVCIAQVLHTLPKDIIHSWLSRCSTTREPSTGLCRGGPAKVKSILITEGSPEVEITNPDNLTNDLVLYMCCF